MSRRRPRPVPCTLPFAPPSPPVSWFIRNLYAPPSDGAAAVVHAASVPWSREREAAAAVNARWAAGDGTSGSSVRRRAGQPAHATHDLRFYARGLFASPAVTSWRGVPQDPQPGPLDRLRGALWGGTAVLASLLDYPLRRFTGGLVWAAAEVVAAAAAAMAGLLGRGPLRNPWGFSESRGRLQG